MKLSEFTNTCTARIMYGFGQSDTSMAGRGLNYSKEEMFRVCRGLLELSGREGAATVIAIIDNQQTTAAEVLPQLGFVCVQRDLAKHKHPEKKISTYVYTVCDADRVALALPANPWESPEVRRQREEAAAAELARVAEQAQRAAEARNLREQRYRELDAARRNGVDYNNLPAPRGRNRALEATNLYQKMKERLAGRPEAWTKCRRNLRVLFENHPWTFTHGTHMQGGDANNLEMAFSWTNTPQGDHFWADLHEVANGY